MNCFNSSSKNPILPACCRANSNSSLDSKSSASDSLTHKNDAFETGTDDGDDGDLAGDEGNGEATVVDVFFCKGDFLGDGIEVVVRCMALPLLSALPPPPPFPPPPPIDRDKTITSN